MSIDKAIKYKERLKSLKSKSLSELKSILKDQLRITATTGYGKNTAISEILENEFGAKFMDEMITKNESTQIEKLKDKFEAIGTRILEPGKIGVNFIIGTKVEVKLAHGIIKGVITEKWELDDNDGKLALVRFSSDGESYNVFLSQVKLINGKAPNTFEELKPFFKN